MRGQAPVTGEADTPSSEGASGPVGWSSGLIARLPFVRPGEQVRAGGHYLVRRLPDVGHQFYEEGITEAVGASDLAAL
jgi:hypothetical protein